MPTICDKRFKNIPNYTSSIIYFNSSILYKFISKFCQYRSNRNFFCTSALFFPLYFAISLLNIIIISRFIKVESSSFMFLFIQSIFVPLIVISESDLLDIFMYHLYPNYYFIGYTFCIWGHSLALTVVLDRFFALSKRVVYRKHSTRKNAILFSLVLLIFSFISQIPRIVIVEISLPLLYKGYCHLLNSIFVFIIITSITIVMIKFRILLKKIYQNSSQLNCNETNITRIVLLSAIIDILSGVNAIIYFLSAAFQTIF